MDETGKPSDAEFSSRAFAYWQYADGADLNDIRMKCGWATTEAVYIAARRYAHVWNLESKTDLHHQVRYSDKALSLAYTRRAKGHTWAAASSGLGCNEMDVVNIIRRFAKRHLLPWPPSPLVTEYGKRLQVDPDGKLQSSR